MNVYVFGNDDHPTDNAALKAAEKLKNDFKTIEFIFVKPNEDLPFAGAQNVVILDCIEGIEGVTVFNEKQLSLLTLSPRSTVHDFDLGFQLRYLQKIGKLHKVTIVGLPLGKSFDYKSLHSTFKKLVAQDMQGS